MVSSILPKETYFFTSVPWRQIINNANFCEINNLLTQGRDMEYIASHYNMDLALAWALRLEGKTDQEKMNYPAAKQRGIFKSNVTPQAAGN